jgi:fatty acid CoA ligase FadD9
MPVRVFRPGLILPDRHHVGQVNVPDLLTRLLLSLVWTGVAPGRFHRGGPEPRADAPAGPAAGPGTRFDGLPVDFVAAAMVALSSAGGEGLETCHLVDDRTDGVSLDTLVDWVRSAGRPVRRIEDHAAWFQAFREALEALDPDRRRRSSLPILQQWAEPEAGGPGARANAGRFAREVARLRPGGEGQIPRLTEAYLHKYLADLEALGLLGEPSPSR